MDGENNVCKVPVFVGVVLLVISWAWPPPRMPVGCPTKNVIILVVTVTVRGPHPSDFFVFYPSKSPRILCFVFFFPKHGMSKSCEFVGDFVEGSGEQTKRCLFPSKVEWDLTNGPLSKLRSSYQTLRFRGPFSGSCWRFLGLLKFTFHWNLGDKP